MPDPTAQKASLLNLLGKLARYVAIGASGPARKVVADISFLDPDLVARPFLFGLHADLAASASGTDVQFDTNPDFDVAIYDVRAAIENGTGEATATARGDYSAAHASVALKDADRTVALTGSKSPAAGSNGIDLNLLGANGGHPVEFKVPYALKGQKGSSSFVGTFSTDADWPGTRRMGVLLNCVYKRRGFRQAESV